MKIGYCSDIHLEFSDKAYAKEVLAYFLEMQDKVDLLVIAGDLHSDWHKRKRFLEGLKPNHFFIPGNHDFRKTAVVNNTVKIDGDIIGATLWTNFNNDPLSELVVRDWWDFRNIPYWTTATCKYHHEVEKKAIFDSSCPFVITHFAPSLRSVEEKYKNAGVENYYFCNNLDEEIEKSNKKLWIHGHVHSQHDYWIGDCHVLANPWGYPNECSYPKEVKVIEI